MNEQHNRRKHTDLRKLVDEACEGLLPSVQERVKRTVRAAYYFGAAEGIEVGRGAKPDDLIEKTISNCEELMAATTSPDPITEMEKQERYVKGSLDRCIRCGAHTPAVLPCPPLSLLCGDCQRTLKATDGGAMWFAEMVANIKEKSNEGNTGAADTGQQ